ncbi:hypothetical protein PO124_30065 [Bacillus licheniformis]|nr:hypothetical protein [Bacillus licheniformis]
MRGVSHSTGCESGRVAKLAVRTLEEGRYAKDVWDGGVSQHNVKADCIART